MAVWQVVVVAFLALVLVAGVVSLTAERRGWITNERLRRIVRRVYRLDRPQRKDIDRHDDE
ncbi:MAG TPA: hypothetical protein VJY33_17660 [Isosphaeraceae bacterium]|nr:hypothetical protein [Isosphaeraceae bacterium]